MTPEDFIESVLSLQPRVAAFDCDGTLWAGDSGQDFFYWEMEERIVPSEVAERAVPRYSDYKLGKVAEQTMCGEMVTINAGLPEGALQQAAKRFFDRFIARRIFPEMVELASRLSAAGCALWAVSSTNQWVVSEGASRFGIPPARVLAASVRVDSSRITDQLLYVPTGAAKAQLLAARIPHLDVAFGNSIHDLAMLELAYQPFVVNPSPDLRAIAVARKWPVYQPRDPA